MGNPRTGNKEALEQALIHLGTARLSEIWGVSAVQAGRLVGGQQGVKIEDLSRALDEAGVRVLPPTDESVLVDKDELRALKTLARKSSLFAEE